MRRTYITLHQKINGKFIQIRVDNDGFQKINYNCPKWMTLYLEKKMKLIQVTEASGLHPVHLKFLELSVKHLYDNHPFTEW